MRCRFESLPKMNSHVDGQANGRMELVMDSRTSLLGSIQRFISALSDASRAGFTDENNLKLLTVVKATKTFLNP